jgi:hypothetical protein
MGSDASDGDGDGGDDALVASILNHNNINNNTIYVFYAFHYSEEFVSMNCHFLKSLSNLLLWPEGPTNPNH